MVKCNVVQWRRVRRKVLLKGKTVEQVAMQESLTVSAITDILTQRPNHKPLTRHVRDVSPSYPDRGLTAVDRELLQWSQCIYALEQ